MLQPNQNNTLTSEGNPIFLFNWPFKNNLKLVTQKLIEASKQTWKFVPIYSFRLDKNLEWKLTFEQLWKHYINLKKQDFIFFKL